MPGLFTEFLPFIRLFFCPKEELFGWEDSWQLSDADFEVHENEDDDDEEDNDDEDDDDEDYDDDEDDNEDDYYEDDGEEDDGEEDDGENDLNESMGADSSATLAINEVFLPDWSDSCLLNTPSLEPEEERNKIWSISFGYRQQMRWVHKVTTIALIPKFFKLQSQSS